MTSMGIWKAISNKQWIRWRTIEQVRNKYVKTISWDLANEWWNGLRLLNIAKYGRRRTETSWKCMSCHDMTYHDWYVFHLFQWLHLPYCTVSMMRDRDDDRWSMIDDRWSMWCDVIGYRTNVAVTRWLIIFNAMRIRYDTIRSNRLIALQVQ